MASHPFESARAATLSALIGYAKAESRIEALWLQGSLAAGGADPFSDIDAYLAIRDEAYDAAWEDREGVLARLGPRSRPSSCASTTPWSKPAAAPALHWASPTRSTRPGAGGEGPDRCELADG